jgi:3-deoxy-D-manno-octulosonate 8-phosphate phosphatase (KDO 8-P phosphatase)
MAHTEADLRERAARVRVILMDVDGVLTDGRVYMGSNGYDGRAFHVRDGQGVRMGQRGGLLFGIISGRESRVVAERAAELYITEIHQGVYDKSECLQAVLQRLGVAAEQACFVGDDLVDVPAMRRVGLAAAPADAVPEVREAAHFVTTRPGGAGALREIVDLVLQASGKWTQIADRYLR